LESGSESGFWIGIWILDWNLDFWIGIWISGLESGFLDWNLDSGFVLRESGFYIVFRQGWDSPICASASGKNSNIF
jgi:hypothetical protein